MRPAFFRAAFLVAILAAACFFAAAYLVWTAPQTDLSTRPVRVWSPGPMEAGFEQPTGTVSGSYRASFERPIFNFTRRPFDPAALAASQAKPPRLEAEPEPAPAYDASQLTLKGIMVKDGDYLALIASPEAPDGIWVALGGEVMNWRVVHLDKDMATLQAGAQTTEIKLYVDNGPN